MGKESKKMYIIGNLADSMFDDLTFCKERIWVIMSCECSVKWEEKMFTIFLKAWQSYTNMLGNILQIVYGIEKKT